MALTRDATLRHFPAVREGLTESSSRFLVGAGHDFTSPASQAASVLALRSLISPSSLTYRPSRLSAASSISTRDSEGAPNVSGATLSTRAAAGVGDLIAQLGHWGYFLRQMTPFGFGESRPHSLGKSWRRPGWRAWPAAG